VTGRIVELSLGGLRLAAGGSWAGPADAAQWLYRFGSVPRGPAIDRDFGPDDDPMAVLGLIVGGRARRVLEEAYDATSYPGWYSFARMTEPVQIAAARKLYVSPMPDALADAFPRIAEVFVRYDVRSFKVGRGIEGLLRPDKVIAYFDDRTHMESTAAALERELEGCPAQGAPFTEEVGGNGLLSTGVDPPPGDATATSWRSWVTKQLAASLTAPRATTGLDPVATAFADLRRAGVDPDRWEPDGDIFWSGIQL
jgi:hypothetical protein